jgi:hypothetical protein
MNGKTTSSAVVAMLRIFFTTASVKIIETGTKSVKSPVK